MLKNRKAEKHKEELRRLTLLPGNKVCMNCPVRGPMYAVIDFNIFVCTQCSAIHRSLQHKVKGISMSEFTDEEVAGLRVGGNERAATIWRVGFPYGVPREGDERAIRNNVLLCFVERRYFNAAEHEKLQNDQLHACLPPVTGLPSGVTLQTPSAPATQNVTHQFQPSPQHPPPVLQGKVVPQTQSIQTAPPVTTAPHSNQDFFAGNVPSKPVVNHTPPMDDFFGPSSSSAPQPTVPKTANNNDFFLNSAPHVAQSSSRGGDDFFGEFGSSNTNHPNPTQAQPKQPQTFHDDFFGGPSSFQPHPQPTVNATTTFVPTGVALGRKEGGGKRDAFADLDPFAR